MSSTEKKLVRVLIVEDSRVIMEFLTHVLNSDPHVRDLWATGRIERRQMSERCLCR